MSEKCIQSGAVCPFSVDHPECSCSACIKQALALLAKVNAGDAVVFPIALMHKLVSETENNPYGSAADGIRMVWVECELLAKSPVGPLFDTAGRTAHYAPKHEEARL